MENLKKIKATVDSPFFGAQKWNTSVNYIEVLEKILSSINSKIQGIFDSTVNYKIGEYVFFNGQCYEVSEDYSQSFFTNMIHKDFYYLRNNKIHLDGNSISENLYDIVVRNYDTKELLCVSDSSLELYDIIKKTFTPVPINNSQKIIDASIDKYSIYFAVGRKVFCRNRVQGTIEQREVLNSNLLIKAMTINPTKVFVLLSDNSINVINREDDTLITNFKTNKAFSLDAMFVSTNDNNLFLADKNKIYCYQILDNDLRFKSEIDTGKNVILNNISKHGEYVVLDYIDGNFVSIINTLIPLKKSDFSKLLLKGTVLTKEDLEFFIKPSQNLIDNKKMKIINKQHLFHEKDKGINITQPLNYDLKTNLINKTVLIETNSQDEEIEIRVNNNRKIVLANNSSENISRKTFLDIKDSFVNIYRFTKDGMTFAKENLLPSISATQTVTFSTNTNLILEGFYVFNRNLEKAEIDSLVANELYVNTETNESNFLPHAIVSNDEFGSARIKLANQSLVNTQNGLTINFSDNYENPLEEEDKFKTISLASIKNMCVAVNDRISNEIGTRAQSSHKHDWEDILNVPNATTTQRGVVVVNNDVENEEQNKVATAFMVKRVQTQTLNEINNTIGKKLQQVETGLGNVVNNVIPQINGLITGGNSGIKNLIQKLEDRLNTPNYFLDKRFGGEIKSPINVTNIDIGNDIIKIKKKTGKAGIYFGDNYLIHEVSTGGLQTFKLAPANVSSDQSGGIEIGYKNGEAFYRTSFISSSGAGSFKNVVTSGDSAIGRDIRVAGDVILTSDKRIKSEIKIIPNCLDKICNLNGYTFKKQGFEKTTAGVIAQEVNSIMPELTDLGKDNILGVNYNGLHALEIEAIKELKKENEMLKERLSKLEEKLK